MSIPNGDFVKAKWVFYKNKFKTREGLFDFFVGTALWGFLIIEFNRVVFEFLFNLFSAVPIFIVQKYLAYLAFGIFASVMGIFVTVGINRVYDFIIKFLKKANARK